MKDRWPVPLLLTADGGAVEIHRAPLGEPPVTEGQLQEILEEHPDTLPLQHFDPLFGPAVCIGREVPTNAGPIDHLFISASGYITLVETKLWKNPEARRTVVAQVIDYTKQIVRWDYAKLEERFQQYAGTFEEPYQSLYAYVADYTDMGFGEPEFCDAASRCLATGRLLLLIVGDGIREGVEEMASYLQKTPNLQFTLGLVELSCYEITRDGESAGTLIVPRIVAKTAEVERAIVRIEMTDEASRQVQVDVRTPSEKRVTGRPVRPSEDEFYDVMEVAPDMALAIREWAKGLIEDNEILQDYFTKYLHRLRIQLPSSDRPPLPFLDIGRAGTISVDVRFAPILSDEGYPDEIAEGFFAEVTKIAPGMLPRRRKDGTFIVVRKKGLSPQERESHAANLRRVISKREDLQNEIRRFLNTLLAAADSEE